LTVQPKQNKPIRRRLARLALAVPLVALAASPAAVAQDCDVRGTVERPTEDAVVSNQPVVISGWAADIGAEGGTGISEVRIALDADPDQGGVAVPALYGWQRPDVAELLASPRFTASGLALSWDATGVAPGRHTLYIQARSACGWITVTRTVLVAGQQSTTAPASPTPVRSTAPGATTPGGTAPGTGPTAPGAVPGTGPTAPGAGQTAPGTAPGTGPTAPGGVTAPTAPGGVTAPTAPGSVTAPTVPGGVTGPTAPGAVPGAPTRTPTPAIPLAPRTQ
jgi:hypothetical protein